MKFIFNRQTTALTRGMKTRLTQAIFRTTGCEFRSVISGEFSGKYPARNQMRTRFITGLGILLVLAVLNGCSEKPEIREKATWLCKFTGIETLKTKGLPEDEDPKDYIRSEDLAHRKVEKENSNDRPEFGEPFPVWFEPVAGAIRKARAEHTDCKITDIKVNGESASATVHSGVPQLDSDIDIVSELKVLDSDRKRLARARKFYANADSKKFNEYRVDFEKGDNGWRANLHLKKKDLVEERDKIEEKLEYVRSKLAELRGRQANAKEARKNLEKFEILESNFRLGRPTCTGSFKPVIILRIRNETGHKISHAFFRGVIKDPSREVPWIEESFNYEPPGGVKPNETVHWSLAHNMFSTWGPTEVPENAEFRVSVTRLDGAAGSTLYRLPSQDLSNRRARLERIADSLEKKLNSHAEKIDKL
jgi:hypothetical protein